MKLHSCNTQLGYVVQKVNCGGPDIPGTGTTSLETTLTLGFWSRTCTFTIAAA